MNIRPDYIAITQDIRDRIESEIERTGFGPQRALKANRAAKEMGLTSGIIYRFIGKISRPAKTGRKDHITLTLRLWADIPNKEDQVAKKQPNPYQVAREKHRKSLLEMS